MNLHVEIITGCVLLAFAASILHELGHYVAAKILNIKVNSLSLGTGKALIKLNVCGTVVLVRSIFFLGGEVSYNRSKSVSRPAQVIVNLAGPAANLITAIVVLLMTADNLTTVIDPTALFFWLNCVMLLNLIPIPGSDGHNILSLYKHK